eukprot:m.354083 g.354083  ORF g.354083 m.354083 type:complete len:1300 (+) comp19908_c0_seq6:183-4082(+)
MASDETVTVVMGTIILATLIWYGGYILWDRVETRKTKKRSRRRNKQSRKDKFRSENRRVHEVLLDSQRVAHYCLGQSMSKNVKTELFNESRMKMATAYRIIALSLKEFHVDLLDMGGIVRHHSGVVKLSKDARLMFKAVEEMEDIREEITDAVLQKYTSPKEASAEFERLTGLIVVAADRLGRLVRTRIDDWTMHDPEFQEFEAWVNRHVAFKDVSWARMDKRGLDKDDDNDDFPEDMGRQGRVSQFLRRWIPKAFQAYPYFYLVFFTFYFAIFFSFVPSINGNDIHRQTFLSLPPQYNFEKVRIQRIFVPIIYGIMHTVLYCLGVLPSAMTRGFHRDFVRLMPWLRILIPFDDMVYFHRLVGYLALGGLMAVACIWIVVMGLSCNVDGIADDAAAQAQACLAFNPVIADATTDSNDELKFDSIPGASYFDPRDNVLFLREMVWPLWFIMIPLILWANTKPTIKLVPQFIVRNWYEICFYSHVIAAYATVVAALYARFEVFYPIVLSWVPYFLDLARERIWYTSSAEILVDARPMEPTSLMHESSVDMQPTLLSLTITRPKRFMHGAGQWMYLQVPSIDRVWHPFSLASSSADSHIHLHVGIRGEWDQRRRTNGQWVQPMEKETWTYKLLEKFRAKANTSAQYPASKESIKCLVRGSYGSPFTKCFQRKYPAVVIIGAGTGLTSALSVLKQQVYRHVTGKSHQYVFFVWSCRRVDDLLWCWATLQSSLYDACRRGAIDLDEDWRPLSSAMLDWLSVTIYVTRSDHSQLMHFLWNEEQGKDDTLPEGAEKAGDDATLMQCKQPELVSEPAHFASEELRTFEVPAMQDFAEEEEEAYEKRLEDIVTPMRRRSSHALMGLDGSFDAGTGSGVLVPDAGTPTGSPRNSLVALDEINADEPNSPVLPLNKRPSLFDAMQAVQDMVRAGKLEQSAAETSTTLPASPSKDIADRPRKGGTRRTVHFALDKQSKFQASARFAKQRRATIKPSLRKPKAPVNETVSGSIAENAWVAGGAATLAPMHGPLTASAQLEEPIYDYAEEETAPELMGWMFGQINEELAEAVLNYRERGQSGDFLVRLTAHNDAILSVLVDSSPPAYEHIDLHQDASTGEFSIAGKPLSCLCANVADVIHHLLEKPEGLPCPLRPWQHKGVDLAALDARAHVPRLDHSAILDELHAEDVEQALPEPRKRRGRKGGIRRISDNEQAVREAQERIEERVHQYHESAIHEWLKAQVLETSMDSQSAHISRLLAWVREFVADPVNEVVDGRRQPIAICFCGPPPVARLVGRAAEQFGGHMEYSAESQ